MRILYLSCFNEDMNVMHNNILNNLLLLADVTCFGPGFSTERELDNGIEMFVKESGPYDITLYAGGLLDLAYRYTDIDRIYMYYQLKAYDVSIYQCVRFSKEALDHALENHGYKAFFFANDPATVTDRQLGFISSFISSGGYYVGVGGTFLTDSQTQGDVFFGGYKINSKKLLEVLRTNYDRVIEILLAAASQDMFYSGRIEQRPYDWVIPGNNDAPQYPIRARMFETLNKSKFCLYTRSQNSNWYNNGLSDKYLYNSELEKGIVSTFDFPQPNQIISKKPNRENWCIWKEQYAESIKRSKFAYADGGKPKTPVAKYFEIPIRGAVLMCTKCYGFEELGFEEGVNCISVSPDNVIEKTAKLMNKLDYAQKIADNGQRLVIKKHTSYQRAKDLVKAFDRIINGTYKGCHWEKGDFVMN